MYRSCPATSRNDVDNRRAIVTADQRSILRCYCRDPVEADVRRRRRGRRRRLRRRRKGRWRRMERRTGQGACTSCWWASTSTSTITTITITTKTKTKETKLSKSSSSSSRRRRRKRGWKAWKRTTVPAIITRDAATIALWPAAVWGTERGGGGRPIATNRWHESGATWRNRYRRQSCAS